MAEIKEIILTNQQTYKSMKKYLLILIAAYPILLHGQVTNIDRLPQPERDSALIAIAKQIILKYGPDYYEENEPLIIKRRVLTKEDEGEGGSRLAAGARAGRIEYEVGYLMPQEYREKYPDRYPYTVRVSIWEDTGLVGSMMFGGYGCGSIGLDPNADPSPDAFIFVKGGKTRVVQQREYEQWKRDNGRK